MDTIKEIDISKINGGFLGETTDSIVVEKLMKIYVNYELYKVLMCTPSDVLELATGFLFSEGIISSINDIESMEEKYGDRICVVLKECIKVDYNFIEAASSGCGNGSVQIRFLEDGKVNKVSGSCRYSHNHILSLMKIFNGKSELFKFTGGVHSCAICDRDKVIYFTEDVGRHNALDKVLGKALMDNLKLEDKFVLTTGRISSDIIVKAAKAGIPMMVSHSAPTDLSIDIAKAADMTVIGFARGNRMNIYCGENRICI